MTLISGSTASSVDTGEPVYQVHVFCCTNERPATHWRGSCGAKRGRQLCDYMCRLAMTLGMRRIRINHAGCMNVCEHGPVMVIYPEGVWYRFETEDDVSEILRSHVGGGRHVDRLRLFIDPSTIHG
ncbi:(2Fe-2S) ferredoxin domain-containing protein (plasmid) [Brucella anthropi]|jgi:(2Fe-2S) ferredoxin|nr:(2Fe-2S) ferredoxin domain-containing protein [Ochrobactrum sp. XJ1]UVV71061.1 (2Fe-2S) ferredoxin domain-containing protein [Brucella anthropi]